MELRSGLTLPFPELTGDRLLGRILQLKIVAQINGGKIENNRGACSLLNHHQIAVKNLTHFNAILLQEPGAGVKGV